MYWTDEEVEILRREYADPDIFPKDIAVKLGRSLNQVYNKAKALGLHAPIERIRFVGKRSSESERFKATQFKKGNVPPNKGQKMSPEVYAMCAKTMFKKGHQSHNYRDVGSERVNTDGYVEIKVAERTWRLKHRVIWEQHNGEIPKGMNIQFKNHNTQDCRIENLYMISQVEQMRTQNSYMAKYPKEVQDVIRLKGFVNRVIRKREKDNEQ